MGKVIYPMEMLRLCTGICHQVPDEVYCAVADSLRGLPGNVDERDARAIVLAMLIATED